MTPEREQELLALCETDTLYKELLSRFDHIVISAVKARPVDAGTETNITSWRLKGNYILCQGLACGIISECQRIRDDDELEIPSDEL